MSVRTQTRVQIRFGFIEAKCTKPTIPVRQVYKYISNNTLTVCQGRRRAFRMLWRLTYFCRFRSITNFNQSKTNFSGNPTAPKTFTRDVTGMGPGPGRNLDHSPRRRFHLTPPAKYFDLYLLLILYLRRHINDSTLNSITGIIRWNFNRRTDINFRTFPNLDPEGFILLHIYSHCVS